MNDQLAMFSGPAEEPPEDKGIVLRDYQVEALDRLRDGLRRNVRRQMMCLPTGGGKTVIAAGLLQAAVDKGSRAAFVADRITLVDQTSTRLYEAGVQHGVAQGENRWGHQYPVHVWSAQTLERAFEHRDVLADYDLLVIDEAHVVRKLVVEKMREADIPTVGLSATPFTKGLGDIYGEIVNVRTTDKLVEDGWLVPFRIFAGTPIDMSGAKVQGGEWTDREVSDRTLPVIGNIVTEWREKAHQVFGEGRNPKTLVFSASVANGRELCNGFNDIGVTAEQISYRDRDDEERRAKIKRFEEGATQVLASVDALSRGFDVPSVECIVMARPFRRSMASIIQQLGRGMRIAKGKEPFCLLLDHALNYVRFADRIEQFWAAGLSNLDDGTLEKQREPSETEDKERICPDCKAVAPKNAEACPVCGCVIVKRSRTAVTPGRLVELQRGAASDAASKLGVADLWPHCCAFAISKYPDDGKRQTKMARVFYKSITGQWPAWGRRMVRSAECDPAVAQAINEQRRKYMAQKFAIEKARSLKSA